MPTAKKLPSGSYRVQVFSHFSIQGGKKKRIYESFTAPTKREAERMAAIWATQKTKRSHDMSISEAIDQYIALKSPVLSPSTIAGYEKLKRNYFQELGQISIENIKEIDIQAWIGRLSMQVGPKTVSNAYGLLSAVLTTYRPHMERNITLPAKIKPDLYVPCDADIKKLLDHIKGTELEIAVLLAAFGPLRRSEICALTSNDISGNIVRVKQAIVLDDNKNWVAKQPKTYSSYREIALPDFVIEKINKINGRIIKATPDQISNRFKRAVKSCRLPHFRFHDLRHYSASIMHAIGVPDQYIMKRGGWKTDNVLKTVYRNVITAEDEKQTEKINSHFIGMQHEMQHKK